SVVFTVLAMVNELASAGVTASPIVFGAGGTFTPYQGQAEASLTLPVTNGANQDLGINATANLITLTGSTGNFSIGGIGSGFAGQEVSFRYTGVNNLTINNEDAGSVAANRLRTFTGVNLALTGICCVTLKYSGVLSRWEVHAARDSTGPR